MGRFLMMRSLAEGSLLVIEPVSFQVAAEYVSIPCPCFLVHVIFTTK